MLVVKLDELCLVTFRVVVVLAAFVATVEKLGVNV